MKKAFVFLLLLALSLGIAAAAQADAYRTLGLNMKGDDVLAVKERLYELGYFTTSKLTDTYNQSAQKAVRSFQKNNGLEETGAADSRTQAVLFSDQAKDTKGKTAVSGSASSLEAREEAGDYRDLKTGAYGSDVEALKKALQKAGFFTGKKITNKYDADMEAAVKKYQQANGLPETGAADAEMQRQALSAPAAPTVEIAAVTPKVTLDLPETDEDGFLPDGTPAFVYVDADAGYWFYLDQKLRVEICRCQQSGKKVTWYEADVRCREGVGFTPILAQGSRQPGHNFLDPISLAEKSKAVFAVTDDNYGNRWYSTAVEKKRGYYQGVVIRDGDVKADIMPPENYTKFPALDVMAYYPDGTVEMYGAREYTAQEYLDMGAVSTWAFGPILIQDGNPNDYVYDQSLKSYTEHMAKEPRMAMGYYEKGHYVFIDVVGRTSTSDGVTLPWLVDRLRQLGVKDAFNLDGGQTAVMCFMGKAVNKSATVNRDRLRKVSSMIGIGIMEP